MAPFDIVAKRLQLAEALRSKLTISRADLERIAWRRASKIAQRGNFDEKYPESWQTAFLVGGRLYFDKDLLIARKMELVNFRPFQIIKEGEAVLFHPRIANRRYVIGADPATGRTVTSEDTDFCCAVVCDLLTGEEMAMFRARVTPQDFAFDLADLGRYYNDAIIGVERTGDGGTTILTLAGDCKYHAIYKHRQWERRQQDRKIIELEGFPTTPKTRPVALNMLQQFIMETPELIWDPQFLTEALLFVRDEKGKPAAAPNAHDDTVSARWIAHYIRRVLLGYYDPLGPAKREGYVDAQHYVPAAA